MKKSWSSPKKEIRSGCHHPLRVQRTLCVLARILLRAKHSFALLVNECMPRRTLHNKWQLLSKRVFWIWCLRIRQNSNSSNILYGMWIKFFTFMIYDVQSVATLKLRKRNCAFASWKLSLQLGDIFFSTCFCHAFAVNGTPMINYCNRNWGTRIWRAFRSLSVPRTRVFTPIIVPVDCQVLFE